MDYNLIPQSEKLLLANGYTEYISRRKICGKLIDITLTLFNWLNQREMKYTSAAVWLCAKIQIDQYCRVNNHKYIHVTNIKGEEETVCVLCGETIE